MLTEPQDAPLGATSPSGYPPSPTGDSPHEPSVRPWELELLISGAVTFTLLQLPGRLDGWFARIRPRLDGALDLAAFGAYEMVSIVLYTLIGAFTLHLAVRAYWVGLIGLETVFPHGIRWEGTRYGPVVREVYSRRIGRLQPVIDRADRFCSVIFSAAFAWVAISLFSLVLVSAATAVAYALSALLFGGRYLVPLFAACVAAYTLPSSAVTLVDRHVGHRVATGGRAYRVLERVARFSYAVSGVWLFGVVFMTLLSNFPRRVFNVVFGLTLTALIGTFMFRSVVLGSGAVRFDSYSRLPDGGSRTLSAAHYDNLRSADAEPSTSASIQSDVVEGPYVKLFIPFLPERMNALMEERCPEVRPSGGAIRLAARRADTASVAGQEAVIRCWTSIQPVRLNGRPVAPDFRFYRHPVSGLRGMIAYIPTAGLPAGENVLEVGGLPRPLGGRGRARPPTRIPFWR